MTERALLMELVEGADAFGADWDDALRRAGFRARRVPRLGARRVLVLAVVLLAAAYAITAVAADRSTGLVYWLFDDSPRTFPRKEVATVGAWHEEKRAGLRLVRTDRGLEPDVLTVPVLEGELAGERFELEAFTTNVFRPGNPPELYVGFHAGGVPPPYYGTSIPQVAGGGAGFPVHGLPVIPGGEAHWVGWTLEIPGPIKDGGGTGPKYFAGVANAEVATVDLVESDGRVVSVPTLAAPTSVDAPVRLWVAALRLDELVETVVPRDAAGNALEHWRLRTAQ